MNASEPNEDVEKLKLELELEKLDRQWLEERKRYLSRGQEVNTLTAVLPAISGILVGIYAIGTGLSGLADPDHFPDPVFLVVLGSCVIGAGVLASWYYARLALKYSDANQRYEDRRQKILQDISGAKAEGD